MSIIIIKAMAGLLFILFGLFCLHDICILNKIKPNVRNILLTLGTIIGLTLGSKIVGW